MQHIIAISGAVASGKSTLTAVLTDRFGAHVLSTRALIRALRQAADERGVLQLEGDALDAQTDGAWVADEAGRSLADLPDGACLVIDAVRKPMQIDRLRERWLGLVHHVHLSAPADELERRYRERLAGVADGMAYAAVKADPTEASIDALATTADVVIDTAGLDRDCLVAQAVAGTRLLPRTIEPLVDVIVGAQYGSEGKGNVCAALAPNYAVLMRVGGPNAGHKVRDPAFTFRHLPSGTAHNRAARLLIGAGATISVEILLEEIAGLAALGCKVDGTRLSIDPQAVVIEQSDRDYEGGSLDVIASTKQGVGVAAARKVIGRSKKAELGAEVRLARDVEALKPFVRRVDRQLEAAYAAGEMIMLEGTQGTDLSLHHGIWPNVTSRDTTAAGCLAEAGIAPRRVRRVVMVTRTFPIRVGGTSGDFAAGEMSWKDVASRSGIPEEELVASEEGSVSHNLRRVGAFSWEQVRRAAVLNGATDIALTFADYLGIGNREAATFAALEPSVLSFIDRLEKVTATPVTYVSKGPETEDVLTRGPHA